ncbi:MAG: purine-nucleoside phosphorylase, partial [Gaiellaceae bacterium]|nr:purine-nucleoside phosphorylase [Gaiellaceae bacterium]
VGDPGRALMLAQDVLEAPKMSNHARGLWGYTGRTATGRELSLQATGIGGPSAALVLADLAELGVRRAVRVGTCTGLRAAAGLGDLVLVEEAHAWGGPGGREGEAVLPDPGLTAALRSSLGDAGGAAVASLDTLHGEQESQARIGADAADMQTAALFARGATLGIRVAAVLLVDAVAGGDRLDEETAEEAAKRAGRAAAEALDQAKVEG